MKAVPLVRETTEGGGTKYREVPPRDATHIRITMPGPMGNLLLAVHTGQRPAVQTSSWHWNGDVDKPTLKPSVLNTRPGFRCHSFITDGIVDFLRDTTHELSGQKVPLLDVD